MIAKEDGSMRRWTILLAVVALVLTVFTPATMAADADPVQWSAASGGNDHWYQLSPRPVEGLDDAIELAASTTWMGQPGYVVSILSEGEKDLLVDAFGGESEYVIGYTDRDEEGSWTWVSGEPSGYEFWASGEPNDYNDEDYAVMNWQHEHQPEGPEPPGAWNDLQDAYGFAIFEFDGLTVSIDITPGGHPNSLNIDGHGLIPVAILGSADFDVTQIDTATLEFAGLEVSVKKNGSVQCSVEDVSGDFTHTEGAQDGYLDLVCHFVDDPEVWSPDNGTAALTGLLLPSFGGTAIFGSDVYRLVPPTSCTDPLGCAEYGVDDSIVIGTALALTGVADLGLGELRGAQLAVLQRGMLFGRSLTILSEDAQCSPEGGVTAALALVAEPMVAAVVGTSCSGSAFVAAPIVTDAGYSMVSPSNTAPRLTDPSTHELGYLRVADNDRLQAGAMAGFAHAELGAATSAIIRQDDGYSAALADTFVQSFTDIGGTNLVIEVLDSDSPDVGAAVSSIIASGPPDLIYLLAFEPLGSDVVVEIRDQPALSGTMIASSGVVISSGFLANAGAAADRVYATVVAPPSGPAYDAFVVAYEVEFGEPPATVFDAYAFDASNMILDAVAVVGSELAGTLYVGRQELRDALFATTGLAGVTGEISCDSYGDCAESRTVPLWQVQGGEFIQVAS
jgi:branched-chain amino acid transport system substrate-binding protein